MSTTLPRFVDTLPQAVVVVDAAGFVTYWNRFAEELYGWSRDEAVGKRIVDLIAPPQYAGMAEEIVASLIGGMGYAGAFTVRHREGHEFEVFVVNTPLISEGRITGVIGVSLPVAAIGDGASSSELTRREVEVLRLTAEGASSADVAERLGISRRTVESHRANIHRKLGISSRTELILYAVRSGLLRIT